MTDWKTLQRYWYLIAASVAILVAIVALLVMQYRSVRNTEAQARATLTANLDIHLVSLVEEAKRDMVSHADHITHSIYQRLVRERNIPGLARAFTRASRRFPEVDAFYVVFFDSEGETWRAFQFVPPTQANSAAKPASSTYLGVPVGTLQETDEVGEALRRAWLSREVREELTTFAVYAPLDNQAGKKHQIFFHPVYESGSMDAQRALRRVGLIALTASVGGYPSADYFKDIVARHEHLSGTSTSLLGQLSYSVRVREGDRVQDLVAHDEQVAAVRVRGFDRADGLFPGIEFGVAPRDMTATAAAGQYTQTSIMLGLCAAALAFIGLVLTWRATQREMRVAQLKSTFLANISHELKTPLTAIRAFGDLLHSGRARDPNRIRQYGEMIKSESDRLTALINNILEVSRLERGVRRYRLEEGDLCESVAATIEIFRHTAEAKPFLIAFDRPPNEVRVRFEEGAIHQAVLNLLSNAAKYSDANQADAPRIEVAVRSDAREAFIEVRDFGIGISKPEQQSIFMPFHRAAQSDAFAKGGTGLGLAIVSEVARSHGGRVSVESEAGAGSTFRICLPLAAVSRKSTEEVSPEKIRDGEYFGDRGRAKRGYRIAR